MAAHQAPRPWDSPGKNTGVGCHFLLQCMQVKSESEVAQSCPTLSDPMDCSLPGSSAHRILQATVLEWGASTFSVNQANQHIKLSVQTLGKQSFTGTFIVTPFRTLRRPSVPPQLDPYVLIEVQRCVGIYPSLTVQAVSMPTRLASTTSHSFTIPQVYLGQDKYYAMEASWRML